MRDGSINLEDIVTQRKQPDKQVGINIWLCKNSCLASSLMSL